MIQKDSLELFCLSEKKKKRNLYVKIAPHERKQKSSLNILKDFQLEIKEISNFFL